MRVDLKSELFSSHIDDKALRLAELNDGKLLLVTNVIDLAAQEINTRYKSLANLSVGYGC